MTSLLTTQRERLTEREVERQWNRAQGLRDLYAGLLNVTRNAAEGDRYDLTCIRAALERMEAREDA